VVAINWKPGTRELRKFGASLVVGFGLIGLAFWAGWPAAARPSLAIGLWIGGGAAGLLGLTGTCAALPVYWAWMGVAFVMGNVVSRVALAAVYFLVFTPFGLILRLLGRDPLQLKRDAAAKTYWQDLPAPSGDSPNERQF
jgi:hypothetical protein